MKAGRWNQGAAGGSRLEQLVGADCLPLIQADVSRSPLSLRFGIRVSNSFGSCQHMETTGRHGREEEVGRERRND